jgi:flavin-dependent dehydrogenase
MIVVHNSHECDVLVIGGGPAGSTTAALLAHMGRKVVLLEKDRMPRFHIGESLLPLNLPLFERLGVADEIRRIGVYKPGAEMVSDAHGTATKFRFASNPHLPVDHSYQVQRAEFDKLLLDNSRRLGATILEATRAREVEFDVGERTRITAIGPDATVSSWLARHVVDASGRDTLLASQLGLKRTDKIHGTAAVYGHFRNVPRRDGDDAGMITVHLFEQGWLWMIPLPDRIMSVGVVGDRAFFKHRTDDLNGILARALAASPSAADRMAKAELIRPLVATGNYSYDARRIAGNGYTLTGDAFAFVDPMFSTGVLMAMSSGALAAEAINVWLENRKAGERLLRSYERKMRRGLEAISWLIHRINANVLRDMFMSSIDMFDICNGVVAILAGDFYEKRGLFSPLRRCQLAYGVLYGLSKVGLRLRGRGLTWRCTNSVESTEVGGALGKGIRDFKRAINEPEGIAPSAETADGAEVETVDSAARSLRVQPHTITNNLAKELENNESFENC